MTTFVRVLLLLFLYMELFWTGRLKAVVMLQSNDCEVENEDGTVDYYACTAEPLHLLRNAIVEVDVSPTNYTCGGQREPFCTLGTRECQFCDAAISSEAYPPSYLYDNMADTVQPNKETWWQSITWVNYPSPLEINITMSFNKSYEFQNDMIITFHSSRPKEMILEKSTDFGLTWEPLQYYSSRCQNLLPDGYQRIVPKDKPDTVICTQEYSRKLPYSGGEVKFDLITDRYKLFLGSALTDYEALHKAFNSTNLNAFLTFTDLRIRLLRPATDGKEHVGQFEDLIRYYYGITDIEIVGGCFCNLHGKACEISEGRAVCDCEHNTEGPNCEQCKPLFNKRLWKPGFYLPFPNGTANECEKCECNDHADRCLFNTTQQRALCLDCYHNTTGINCEKCVPTFFRNLSLLANDPNVCQDCDCELLGVVNNDMTCGIGGQCNCKFRVEGRRCSQCKAQYYGLLHEDNLPGECKPCMCNTDGTTFESNDCDRETGQCPCKNHITNRDCSECQEGYYDFPESKPWTDCIDCGCDPGGSESHVCDTNGQCVCKYGVTERQCRGAMPGYYAQGLDHVQLQPQGGTCELATAISTQARPFTGRMFMRCFAHMTVTFENIPPPTQQSEIPWPFLPVLRYSLNASASPWPSAFVEVRVIGNSGVDMSWFHNHVNNTLSPDCEDQTGRIYQFNYNQLTPGYGLAAHSYNSSFPLDPRCSYSAALSMGPDSGADNDILIDSLVLIPDIRESSIYLQADAEVQDEYETCLHDISAISSKAEAMDYFRCRDLTFSVGTELRDGAESCGCDGLGTRPDTLCNSVGGQCQCKPGVTGRRCDMCAPGYFNFSSSGCEACRCSHLGSSNLVCDYVTGQCPCRPFVAQLGENNTASQPADRKCSSCQQNNYGFHSGSGCQLCACTVAGSFSTQCDDYGACHCKETIAGDNCDECLPGFFSFSETGCLPCNCSEAGSLSHFCHNITGQCECKSNVQDVKCNVCAEDSFNLAEDNPEGCQKCFCYGHGTSCISAPGFTENLIYSDSILTSNWTDSSPLTLADNVWLTKYGLTTNDVMYVSAPKQFLGNHLHAYGKTLTFDIRLLGGEDLHLTGTKPIIIQGNGKTIYFDAANITIPSDTTRVPVTLTEHHWLYNDTTHPDYFNMYAILANIEAMHIQRAVGSQVVTVNNITMYGVRLATGTDTPVRNVEKCFCEPNRNVQGLSCELCADGNQRQTINGSVYETCKACDCNSRSDTVPPDCTANEGICLNCRNGTTGLHCELCSAHVTGPECDTCEDTYWGLGADGCQECACNDVGSSSTICEKLDGLCPCQPHVAGRTCSECADNYFNLQSAGCEECDACYNLIYEEVTMLRELQDNITIYVENLQINTGLRPFRERLRLTLDHMAALLTFLKDANDIDSSIAPELETLAASVGYLEEALEMDVSTGIFTVNNTIHHADSFIAHGQKVHDEILITGSAVYDILKGPVSLMISELESLRSDLQNVETSISQISSGAMAEATRVLEEVKSIEEATAAAHHEAEQALQDVHLATQIHANTTQRLTTLETDVAMVDNLGDVVTSEADYLHGNATLARDEVLEAEENSTSMPSIPNDGLELQETAAQLEAQAMELEHRATITGNIIHAGNITIIHDAKEAEDVTSELSLRVDDVNKEASGITDRGTSAYDEVTTAQKNEKQVFDDAENMLDTLQHFTQKATEVETKANESLKLVQDIQGMSESAINTANNLQTSLQSTADSAERAFLTANSTRERAAEEVALLRPVYDEAVRIDAIASPLLNDVQDVADQVRTATQEDIQPARITCEGLESQVQAVENRTLIGQMKAQASVAQVTDTRSKIEDIMADLRNIHNLDLNAIDSLRTRVREARAEFDRRQLLEAISILKEASAEQKRWIEEMKVRRDEAAMAVRRARDIEQQLKP